MRMIFFRQEETPCHHCGKHAPGCHNPETCPDWKEYQEQHAIEKAAEDKRKEQIAINKGYVSESKERIIKCGLKISNSKSNRRYR